MNTNKSTNPAATAAALPPDDPPETFGSLSIEYIGFNVGPKIVFVVEEPIPNSSRLVLPIIVVPDFSNKSITVALYGLL